MSNQVSRALLVSSPAASTEPVSWAYAGEGGERDLRVDFLRGIASFILVVVHVEFFSLFNFVAWERVGPVCAAELFVILSGFVLGSVSRRRVDKDGLSTASWKLLERAAQLYRVNVAVILFVALLALVPWWNSHSLTQFVDRGSGQVYPLYPGAEATVQQWVSRLLLLRMGPHQLQILGLYMCLFILTPVALYLMSKGRTRWLLALSWLCYFARWMEPFRPTGAQFEYGFPLMAWQVMFFHGLAAGYHRAALFEFYARHRRPLLATAGVLAAAGFFYAQNTPNPFVPSYARLSLISADTFYKLHDRFFSKNEVGLLRILNSAALLVIAGELLTHLWAPLHAALGWFFIPLGQASLYVFTVHIIVVLAADNFIPFGYSAQPPALLLNTVGHFLCFAVIWLMVRYRVLFRWIPH